LANIGSAISEANVAAAGPTSKLLAAGADEVSAAVASLFSGHARAFQAISAQAGVFHQKFVQALTGAGDAYASAEVANASLSQTLLQELQGVINAPAQTLLAGIGNAADQVTAAVRLVTTEALGQLGALPAINLGNLESEVTAGLSALPSQLQQIPILAGLPNLSLPAGLKNIPLNLFQDVVNIPYNEFRAIQEFSHALGPAPVLDPTTGLPVDPTANPIMYAPIGPGGTEVPVGIAGTGSWWMESVGNTWFWNNGNWAQLDAIAHMLVPFPAFTDYSAAQLQLLSMAELPANDAFDQYEIPGLPALGHGFFKVLLAPLLSGYTFPDTGPTVTADGVPVVWHGQTVQLVPGLAVESFAQSLTATPTGIQHIPLNEVLPTAVQLAVDCDDFNPFVRGSFLYWGGPTLYGVPSAVTGLVTGPLGLDNPFLLGGAPTGAEPSWGPQANPLYVIPGLVEGIVNFLKAFLGIPGNSGSPL
jgi:hypothetical protein